uniref:Putative secreted protein n=1 Tax=Anopheles darlingi TaxID=43151 RepID=A0A2M4DMN9_ANODA
MGLSCLLGVMLGFCEVHVASDFHFPRNVRLILIPRTLSTRLKKLPPSLYQVIGHGARQLVLTSPIKTNQWPVIV